MSLAFTYLGVGVAAIVSGEGPFVTVRDLLCGTKLIEITAPLSLYVRFWESL